MILGSIPYGRLKARHAEYEPDYWRRLRALYKGGRAIFRDTKVLHDVFPRHGAEVDTIYGERVRRAHYENYVGAIIGHLVDGLFQDPARLQRKDGQTDVEDYWSLLWQDASSPGGEKKPFNQILREMVVEAFQAGQAWTLIDLPDMGPEFKATSRAEEEKAGANDPYLVPIDAERVVNWKCGPAEALEWVLTCTRERVVETVLDTGLLIRETYHLYDGDDWAQYVVEYHDPEMIAQLPKGTTVIEQPKDETEIPVVDSGKHGFGTVPFLRLCFRDGLWALDILDGTARSHLNLTSSLDWAISRSNFPQLYEFLGPSLPGIDQPINEHQENVGRAKVQIRGIGYVQTRGNEDRAEYVTAPTESFGFTQERLSHLRDEMFREFLSMNLAIDNTGAALKRSGESKAQDKASMAVILHGIGERLLKLCEVVIDIIGTLRKEELDATVVGFERFDAVAVTDAIEQALVLGGIDIPSATFHRVHKKALARRVLRGDASELELQAIDKEIEKNVTEEQMAQDKQAAQEAVATGADGASD